MTLAEFGALWFVRKRLALPGDNPEKETSDRPIPTANPRELADALLERTKAARLRAGAPGAAIVTLNASDLKADSAGWDMLFEVRDSIQKTAETPTGPATDDQVKSAIGGFVVLRWIWEDEGGVLITTYPTKNPPIIGDDIEKRLLARILAGRLADAGVAMNDLKEFLDGSKGWKRRFDALDAVLRQVS
jgi:hypothetical protein